jgi:nuclear pore complex protein Nup98-Nup96
LTGYRISDACAEATKTKDLHLATLLALAEQSTREYRGDLTRQLEVWRKDGSWAEIQLWYRAVYELLAGQVDGRGNALGQLGVGAKVDWRRSFAMRLWFGTEADAGIKEAVQEYWMACQHDETIAKPVPWYSTGQNTNTARGVVWDGMFQLLKLYAGQGGMTTLDETLNSYNYISTVTDVRIPWHLYVILHQLRGTASFADTFGAKRGSISETGERLTLSYVSQLENLGLWQWAIFVALHLRRGGARKGVIMDILARRMGILTTSLEEQGITSQLVDQWKIPMEWILEAKVLFLLHLRKLMVGTVCTIPGRSFPLCKESGPG